MVAHTTLLEISCHSSYSLIFLVNQMAEDNSNEMSSLICFLKAEKKMSSATNYK